MENTLVVVTSDHGEEFGEHSFFGHGQHLYSQVLHVPLLVVGPGRVPAERSVAAPVSLRDLPATLVDLLGLADASPFPGRSLARHWADPAAASPGRADPVLSEIDDDDGRFREGPPSRAIVDEGLSYIRSGEGEEELYDLIRDPGETRNLAGDPSLQAALSRLRLRGRRLPRHRRTRLSGGAARVLALNDRSDRVRYGSRSQPLAGRSRNAKKRNASRMQGSAHAREESQVRPKRLAPGHDLDGVIGLEDRDTLHPWLPPCLAEDREHRDHEGDEAGERQARADPRRPPSHVVDR